MKKTIILRVLLALVIAGLVSVLAGCPEELVPVSIADRLNRLEADLNANYDNVYTNWHPESTTRQAGANPSALETALPSSETYTIGAPTISGDNGTTATATATFDSSVTYTNDTATFSMKKDGDDWFILSLSVDATFLPTVVD